MVDHNDDFGAPAPPPEGGFGSSSAAGETGASGGAAGHSSEGHEADFKHPHAAPQPPSNSERHSTFPLVLGGVMVLILIVAWIANSQKPAAPASDSGAAAPAPAASAAPAPDPEAETKALNTAVEDLKSDLKNLQEKIEAIPKPAPPPDLGPVTRKLGELSKETESLGALPRKVEDLDQRLGGIDKTLTALRGDLDSLKSDAKKAAEAAPAGITATAGSDTAKPETVSDSALNEGVDLFKAGKYKEASAAFLKLTQGNSNDARVWYFAALSRGSATNQWTGETTKLVEKAVELEKAGNPDSAKIDAAFADVNPNFKPWLDAYRKTAKPR
jgi:TolA-binding protein